MFSATVMCGYSAYDWKTIAMSRSFGATFVTSRSPIRMRPSSISSRPANIRSDVDLPQPDGPTRTKNSPSLTVRFNLSTAGLVVPGYIRVAFSNTTDAMTVLPSPGRYVPDGPRMKVLAGWLGWLRILQVSAKWECG
ncbi:unannotated protein [freshwater metagenome]|uniref:Unannotated protein n=1 Tax=freshwater metagenome TaxID=449393 RepID=A0A6J6WWR2_9ZZZZ